MLYHGSREATARYIMGAEGTAGGCYIAGKVSPWLSYIVGAEATYKGSRDGVARGALLYGGSKVLP